METVFHLKAGEPRESLAKQIEARFGVEAVRVSVMRESHVEPRNPGQSPTTLGDLLDRMEAHRLSDNEMESFANDVNDVHEMFKLESYRDLWAE